MTNMSSNRMFFCSGAKIIPPANASTSEESHMKMYIIIFTIVKINNQAKT
eukprot:CAMPEP_0116549668 /NCGR_PEP_ID=MMETSP0397-20121206/5007_1 /TAXON_ID=216820 /ORGANISM="Cyclophora tenuis, Strain ECT3854" /LENGTH=49 /DNA_ID=CAMNT_0004074429 /DNA_START=355 /DNA_END=504 /DNA_ORIENTATION=+